MKTFAVGARVKSHFFAVDFVLQFYRAPRFASSLELFLVDTSPNDFIPFPPVAHIKLVKFAHNRKKYILVLRVSQHEKC